MSVIQFPANVPILCHHRQLYPAGIRTFAIPAYLMLTRSGDLITC